MRPRRSDSEVTESRRADAFYRAEDRALTGSAIDTGASPVAIKEMAAAAGRPDVKVVVHYGVKRSVAAARPRSGTLHFSPSALTIPMALHEIAHLIAGSKAQHGEEFVQTFLGLIAHVGGAELAAKFQEILEDEGSGLWDLPSLRPAMALGR